MSATTTLIPIIQREAVPVVPQHGPLDDRTGAARRPRNRRTESVRRLRNDRRR